MVKNKEYQELIQKLTYLRDNFNPASQNELNQFYDLVMLFTENEEIDTELLQLCQDIYQIIENYHGEILNDCQEKCECQHPKEQQKRQHGDPPQKVDYTHAAREYYKFGTQFYQPNLLVNIDIQHNDLPYEIQKCFSYRILCPQSREANYMLFDN